jgi:hypothetical protein
LDRQGDEFLGGRRYLERDGLTHYGEVKYGVSKPWVDPWQSHRPEAACFEKEKSER